MKEQIPFYLQGTPLAKRRMGSFTADLPYSSFPSPTHTFFAAVLLHPRSHNTRQKTHIVVGTPGRLIDHLERETVDLSHIKILVIDEADELFHMGFIEQTETIIQRLPKERVTVLLSATMPNDIEALCHQIMSDPLRIEIEEQNATADRIFQAGYEVSSKDKMELLRDVLFMENPDSCMIFCNTKQKVDEVTNGLNKFGVACEKIHGGMEQADRLRVMDHFKKGYFRFLVATDVAARGIDVENITLVINFDLPLDAESYVHRIGRTGRIENEGRALSKEINTL